MSQMLEEDEYSLDKEISYVKQAKGKILFEHPNRGRRSGKIKLTVKGRISAKMKVKAMLKVTNKIIFLSHRDLDLKTTPVYSYLSNR